MGRVLGWRRCVPSNCDTNSGAVQGAACVCVHVHLHVRCLPVCAAVWHVACRDCAVSWEPSPRQCDEACVSCVYVSVFAATGVRLATDAALSRSTDEWGSHLRVRLAWVASLWPGLRPSRLSAVCVSGVGAACRVCVCCLALSVPGGVPVPRGASSHLRVGFACFCVSVCCECFSTGPAW